MITDLISQKEDDDIYLNDIWVLYFHDPNDSNWNMISYLNLGSINNVQEFWNHHQCLTPHLHQGMFFIMREYVFPSWDDKENINGGCLSIKILKENIQLYWEDLCVKLLGETLINEEYREAYWNTINGISISPKKFFCIVKIWLKDESLWSDIADFHQDILNYNIIKRYMNLMKPPDGADILYKSNRDNISNDNTLAIRQCTK